MVEKGILEDRELDILIRGRNVGFVTSGKRRSVGQC